MKSGEKQEQNMQIKNKKGIGQGMPQTDLQQNTLWTQILIWVVGFMAVVFFLFLIYTLWLTSYIIENNVVNNYIAACIG